MPLLTRHTEPMPRTTSRLDNLRRIASVLAALAIVVTATSAFGQTTLADTQVNNAQTADEQSNARPVSDDESDDDSVAEESTAESSSVSTSQGEPDAESAGTDDSSTSDEEFFGQSHRERMYRESKLSTTRALLYTLAFPGVGNIYAEQYFLAGLAFSLMAFTTMFVLYGITTSQPEFVHMGLVTGGVAYLGGGLSSYLGVKRYNRRLREGFNFDDASSLQMRTPFDLPRVRTIGVTIRF